MRTLSITGKEQYKYLSIIFCIFISVQFICDMLVFELIQIGPIKFTASSALFCIDFALMDIIANVYGMREAQKLAFINFCLQFFIVGTLFFFLLPFNPMVFSDIPNYFAMGQSLKTFGLLMAKNILIVPIAVLIGNLSNAFFMSFSKYLLYGRFVAIRSLICSVLSASLMLSISYTKIYWGTGFYFIASVILSSMIVKIIGASLFMFPSQFASFCLKKYEGVDVYDLRLKFLEARQKEIISRMKKGAL